MIPSKRRLNNWLSAFFLLAFFLVPVITATYLIFGVTTSPQRKVLELFWAELNKENLAEAKKYWCFREIPLNRVYSWRFDLQRRSNSLDSINENMDVEKMSDVFPDLTSSLYKLARFEHFQLIYTANISTKFGSKTREKQVVFDVWEREKLLRYRKLAESILSKMYAEVENSQEGEDLLKSINAAKYASQFASDFAKHPLSGNMENLSAAGYCILSVREINNSEPKE